MKMKIAWHVAGFVAPFLLFLWKFKDIDIEGIWIVGLLFCLSNFIGYLEGYFERRQSK